MKASHPDSVPAATPSAWRLRVKSLLAHNSSLALVDQAIVSGTSFATTLIVGRAAGMAGLGLYSLGFTIVLLCVGLQDALVTQPFTVLLHRAPPRSWARLFGGALVWNMGLIVGAALVLAIAALIVALTLPKPIGLWPVIAVLAATIGMVLLREFARKMSFAHLEMRTALAVDLITSLLLLVGLAVVASLDLLTAVSAQIVVGVACGVAGLSWLLARRRYALASSRGVRISAQRHWPLGKWLLAGQLTWIAHSYSVHWLLAFVLSPAATGLYAACLTIIMLSNPFVIGVGNYLVPRMAQVYAAEGVLGMRRLVLRSTLLMTGVVGTYCGVLMLCGGPLLAITFGADPHEAQWMINLLGLAVLAATLSMPANAALLASERADLAFRAGLAGAVVNVSAAVVAVPFAGVVGAAVAFFAGNVAGTTIRLAMLRQVLCEAANVRETQYSRGNSVRPARAIVAECTAENELLECRAP